MVKRYSTCIVVYHRTTSNCLVLHRMMLHLLNLVLVLWMIMALVVGLMVMRGHYSSSCCLVIMILHIWCRAQIHHHWMTMCRTNHYA